MISTASASISRRTSTGGHLAPVTCSFRFSPVPTPRKKRPGIMAATVAAACATIAGWVRMIGHVTPVPTVSVLGRAGDGTERGPHERALALAIATTDGSDPR